ncbi:MAG TPA: UvrD-helicase domain-containing protein, partial [Beutenbergiaceae bacterium]|nr:UvrD-helicase domain-containing protein [Beutenbergiaceae bacterium]
MITSFDITAALPRGTTVLEASAGTGKTWTIAALTTRLLAQGHAQVGQLLIITFTRAAAAELRSRIHARLTQVSRDLQHTIDDAVEPEQSDELTAFLASHPVEEVGRMIARLRQASRDIDSATITTIHGFCSQALAELGIPTSDDIASETAVDLRAEVAADLYLTTYASQPQPPVLAYNQAAEIARTVTENPTATIHPDDPGDETTQARVDFARTVRTEFHRRKRANGIFTYNDVLTELAGVVDPEHPDQHTQTARQRLRNRWRYVLVDEFQDTDDIQWRILSHVFHTHRDVVLIGDPKQAIYSFRGGDIYTYLDAITHADSAHTLGFNYRSDQALVRGINEVFDGVALGHQDITARPVKSGKPHDTVRLSTPGPRMRVRVVDRDDFTPSESGNVRVGPLRQAIARDVATDVAFLLTEDNRVWDGPTGQWRGVNAGDVAVLCHTNREVELVRHALDEAG